MKLLSPSRALTLLISAFLHQPLQASWDPLPIPFKAPSYIDLEFDQIDFSNQMMTPTYTKRCLFNHLVSQYYKMPDTHGLSWAEREQLSHADGEKLLKEFKQFCLAHQMEFDETAWASFIKDLISTDPYALTDEWNRIHGFCSAIIHELDDPKKIKTLMELRRDLTLLAYRDSSAKQSIQDRIHKVLEDSTFAPYGYYLKIVYCFESQAYDEAFSLAEALKAELEEGNISRHPWLKETVTYLIPRLQLILSQKAWDGYSNPVGTINTDLLNHAEANFAHYLQTYPQGVYVSSCHGLKRRLFMLRADTTKLSKELRFHANGLFNQTPLHSALPKDFDTTVNELNLHLKEHIDFTQDHPLLIAFHILHSKTPQNEEALQQNKDRFTSFPGLYPFLEAQLLYTQGKYQEVVDNTADLLPNSDFLTKSTWSLRAKALAHLERHEEALKGWQELYTMSPEDMVAIEIYKELLKLERPDEIFYSSQGIPHNLLLATMMECACPSDKLETLLHQDDVSPAVKEMIITELLKRYLLRRHYDDFLAIWAIKGEQNLNLTESSPPYGDLLETIKQLVENGKDDKALLNVARFIQEHFESSVSHRDGSAQLEAIIPDLKEQRPWVNKYIPPFILFQEIADHLSKAPKTDMEAETLHHLVMCFKSGSNERRCHLGKSPTYESPPRYPGVSKKAFQKLHKKYSNTTWAKQTPYFYGR